MVRLRGCVGPRRALFAALGVAVLLLVTAGCDVLGPRVCHTGISIDVEPEEAVIAVGGSVAPVVTMESCPRGKREISVEWVADDPAIAAVQAGVITGVSPGETTVRTRDDHEAPHVTVHVTVIDEA